MNPGIGAVVIGGSHGSLGLIRSLGRRGIPIVALARKQRIQLYSRYARRALTWPEMSDRRAVAYLLDIGAAHGLLGWVLFAGGDQEAGFLSRCRSELQNYFKIVTPEWSTMRSICNKRFTYELAQSVGVNFPWTRCAVGLDELRTLDCPFPAILKPAIHGNPNPFTQAKAWLVKDRAELLAKYSEACRYVEPADILVQELIPGDGEAQFSFAAVSAGGIPIASFTARRSRQYPVDFGYTSTFVETTERPEVEESARELLTALRYDGLVEVEFKFDCRDEQYKLLDINGRIWQWLSLGRSAGIDLAYVAWLTALGMPAPRPVARPCAAWLHFSRDLAASMTAIARGNLSPIGYIRSLWRASEYAVLAADDPLPAVADLWLSVVSLLERAAIKAGVRPGKTSIHQHTPPT